MLQLEYLLMHESIKSIKSEKSASQIARSNLIARSFKNDENMVVISSIASKVDYVTL